MSVSSQTTTDSGSATGVGFMVISMLFIPLVDGCAKFLSASFSPLFISWSQYAVACALILPFGVYRYGRGLFRVQNLPAQVLRTVFLVATVTLYHLAISKIPLTLALSAYFVGPLITVGLSILFLGERATPKKLAALALGFVGSLIILKPDGAVDDGIVYAFGAGFFFALYLTLTRVTASQDDPFRVLVFQYALGTLVLIPQAAMHWSVPALEHLVLFLGLGLFAAVAYMLSIMAFRFAEASILAPLVYVELIGSSIVGYVVFDDVPDFRSVLGAGLIVLSGLFVLYENRRS